MTAALRGAASAWAALRTTLGNDDLRRTMIARLASVNGRWAGAVALAVYAYHAGGPKLVGLMGAARFLPAALAAPTAAWLLDRVGSNRVLIGSAALRTVFIAGAGVAALGGAPVWCVVVLAAAEALLSTIVRPLQNASLPFLARTPGELTAANLALTTIESVGMLLGPLLAGALLAFTRPGATLLVTAGCYLVSLLLLIRIPAWQPARDQDASRDAALRPDANVRLIGGLCLAENLVVGALSVLIVVAALRLLNLGSAGVGILNAAVGLGGVLGASLAFTLARRRGVASVFGFGLMLCGAPIVALGARGSTPVTLILLAIVGSGVTLVEFGGLTLLQRTIPSDLLSKALGVLQSVLVVMLGLGALVAPGLISLLGVRGALLATGACLPVLTSLRWRALASLDELNTVDEGTLALLRSIPMFTPLRLPTIERLARALVEIELPPGHVVIRQGDVGDRYYLVRSGVVDVRDGKTVLAEIGAGGGFGEIALLRNVPRTASVTTVTDVQLSALDRGAFLAAVAESSSSVTAADALVQARLAQVPTG
jgi:MFS family permease